MPIKPENRARYPKDWKEIRKRILERAGHKCEDCGVPNYSYRNRKTDAVTTDEMLLESWIEDGEQATRIVLTIAHLDHVPEHCDPANLRAWCQRCHLAYDHDHHQANAYQTRRRGKADGDLLAGLADNGDVG